MPDVSTFDAAEVRTCVGDIWELVAARRLLANDIRGYVRALRAADIFHTPAVRYNARTGAELLYG